MPRKARAAETVHSTREEDTRATWDDAALLEAPPPRQGYRQRWIATSILGTDIPQQVARRMRQGWTPRPAETVPDTLHAPTIGHGQFEGMIGVEGMILCELPEAKATARAKHFQDLTRSQTDFVDQALKDGVKRGSARVTKERKSSFDRGQQVADD